jgi:hypothetical protein
MFSIFKKNRDIQQIPDWASFFSNEDYTEFIKVVKDYFTKKNIEYTIQDGVLTVDTNEFGVNNLGLVNVAQVCNQDEKRNYKTIVKEHFDSLVRMHEFDHGFKKTIHDYNKIKEFIGVRLYSIEYFAQVDKNAIVVKPFAENIYSTLIFDLPDAIQSIKKEEADEWGKTLDELFETGIQNIRQKCEFEISREQMTGDFAIWFVQGNNFFTPNIAFDFNMHPELIGTHGSLIGIPHRHAVIIYPIENIETVNAINSLIPIINGMYHEGPGSISDYLYWYKDGSFENLPYKIEDNKLQFYPPENFVEILNKLSE